MPTTKYLNLDGLSHYKDKADGEIQQKVIKNSNVVSDFDGMEVLATYEFDISDSVYHPIYTIANSNLSFTMKSIIVGYRITVTGTNIEQVADITEIWHSPSAYPLTNALNRTISTIAGQTGVRYLRAVYPTDAYINDSNYPLGSEISAYNATARHIKIEVYQTDSRVSWIGTKQSTIYVDSTHNGNSSVQLYSSRGWLFRSPALFAATSASAASYVNAYECALIGSSVLRTGTSAISANHLAFLSDEDGRMYDISNTTKRLSVGIQRVGIITNNVNANTAISTSYCTPTRNMSATQVNLIPHDTLVLFNRVYLRCTKDSNNYIYSDNYLASEMSPGYTWLPFGFVTTTTTIYMDTRQQHFYTLDLNGKLTHIDGKEIAGGSGGSATDVQINGTTITSGGTANIITEGTYNASSNKIATMSDLPTNTSDLTNNSGYITNTVNNLTNYYKTTETYTKTEIDNKIASVYKYKGTVSTYADLPSTGMTTGDVYNIETADSTHNINPGDNVAWTGKEWDKLGGEIDLSGYQTKIDSTHKLSSDLVDDTNNTNKFVTASEKTTWNGKYSKPSGGIPKTDLASAVQTSLGKADSALQSETDPVFTASAAYGISSNDISNWNGKLSSSLIEEKDMIVTYSDNTSETIKLVVYK